MRPPASSSSGSVRWAAYLGIVCFIPDLLAKTIIALGGTVVDVSAHDLGGYTGLAGWLQDRGVDVTAVFALLGIALLHGLTHRWGSGDRWRRVRTIWPCSRRRRLVPAPYQTALCRLRELYGPRQPSPGGFIIESDRLKAVARVSPSAVQRLKSDGAD